EDLFRLRRRRRFWFCRGQSRSRQGPFCARGRARSAYLSRPTRLAVFCRAYPRFAAVPLAAVPVTKIKRTTVTCWLNNPTQRGYLCYKYTHRSLACASRRTAHALARPNFARNLLSHRTFSILAVRRPCARQRTELGSCLSSASQPRPKQRSGKREGSR